jgi:hypothetical protein
MTADIDYLDLPFCGRDDTHGLAQQEIRAHRNGHDSRPVYLCDDCANMIDPRLAEEGITVTIEPIRSE